MAEIVEHITDARDNGTINVYGVRYNQRGRTDNMPRTKGSKNRVTASTDFDAQTAKLQKDKAMLEKGLSKTVAHIERSPFTAFRT